MFFFVIYYCKFQGSSHAIRGGAVLASYLCIGKWHR